MGVRRCPMCHRSSEERASQCSCGYQFGQPVDKVIELLREQRTHTRITLALAILALASSVVGMLLFPLLAIFLIGGTFLWTGRLLRKLLITRASLKQLGVRRLAEAKLLKG